MPKDVKRRILWNTERAEQGTNTVRWYFLLVNEPRELGRIRERIFTQLQPIYDYKAIDTSLVPNSGGIHYELFYLESECGKFPSNQKQTVYGGLWKRDRRLESRQNESGLLNILDQEGLSTPPK